MESGLKFPGVCQTGICRKKESPKDGRLFYVIFTLVGDDVIHKILPEHIQYI